LDLRNEDVLNIDWKNIFNSQSFTVTGNFPYNISSQILFKIYENRSHVQQMVGMFQKEVAERICSGPGSKKYGILSVLLQAFYDVEYLFTVDENVFNPPPKVKSGVIKLNRNKTMHLDCDEKMFFKVVKAIFNQRRKMARNSLKSLLMGNVIDHPLLLKRPEQLSVFDFVSITKLVESTIN
jgi:16S rRNA (adenine1518-N6/adenine1519-N6)-dimethyltransferase